MAEIKIVASIEEMKQNVVSSQKIREKFLIRIKMKMD